MIQRMIWVITLMIAVFVVMKWFPRDSTIYATGYTWSKFSSIKNGMTPEEVTRILGQPLGIEAFDGDIFSPRQTMYCYSKLRGVKGEYVMIIHFDEKSQVYQIDADRIGHYVSTPGEHPRPSSLLEWLEWYVF